MLQVAFIRNNLELVKERLAIKNFTDMQLLRSIILAQDDRKKMLQQEFEYHQSKLKNISKEIGELIARGLNDMAEVKKMEVTSLKSIDPTDLSITCGN